MQLGEQWAGALSVREQEQGFPAGVQSVPAKPQDAHLTLKFWPWLGLCGVSVAEQPSMAAARSCGGVLVRGVTMVRLWQPQGWGGGGGWWETTVIGGDNDDLTRTSNAFRIIVWRLTFQKKSSWGRLWRWDASRNICFPLMWHRQVYFTGRKSAREALKC